MRAEKVSKVFIYFREGIDMEEVERRSESPASKANNRLVVQETGDLEVKEQPTSKKKQGNSKRKSRTIEKENGEIASATNGDISGNEDQTGTHNGDSIENNVEENVEQEGVNAGEGQVNQEEPEETCRDSEINGDAQKSEEPAPEPEEKVEVKEVANDSINVDTEESYFTADTESIPMDRSVGSGASPVEGSASEDNGNVDSESDRENGEAKTTEASQEKWKGFFGWLTTEKKEPETNGHSDDLNTSNLYFSSIRGREPLSRGTPSITIENDSIVYRRGMRTPNNVRNLDDSFGVKSEPSRTSRDSSKDRPNLRKFPGKRCLNADDPEEKDDCFLSNLTFTKRRKLNDESTGTGFLRNFLWSPFKKRSSTMNAEEPSVEEPEPETATTNSSWFRRPFWFWKRCNREERN